MRCTFLNILSLRVNSLLDGKWLMRWFRCNPPNTTDDTLQFDHTICCSSLSFCDSRNPLSSSVLPISGFSQFSNLNYYPMFFLRAGRSIVKMGLNFKNCFFAENGSEPTFRVHCALILVLVVLVLVWLGMLHIYLCGRQ